MSRRRLGWLAAQTLLGVGLLAAWLFIVDLDDILQTLRQVQWSYVLAALVVGLAASFVRSIRWRLILRPLAIVAQSDVFLIQLASSLINFVIPVRSGELARTLFLKQREGIPISSSLPTVAVDRAFDLLTVLVIGGFGLLGGAQLRGSLSIVVAGGVALLTAFGVFVVLTIYRRDRMLRLAEGLLPSFVSQAMRRRILGVLQGLTAGFTTIGKAPQTLIPLLLLSFGSAALDASVFYLLFTGIGAVVPVNTIVTGYALFALTFIVPGAPGYVGSFEAFGSLVFSSLGAPQAAAASAVVVFHALNAIMLAVAGGLAFWMLGVRATAIWRSIARTEPELAGETADTPAQL